MDRPDLLTLTVANDLGEMPRVAAALAAFGASHALPRRIVNRFTLALEEVLTNVISYAFPQGGRHEIDVAIAWRDGSLQATVSDDGTAFDPLSRPVPDLHLPVEDRRIGGLGIHLLRRLTDAAEYRREGGRNVLTFGMRAGKAG